MCVCACGFFDVFVFTVVKHIEPIDMEKSKTHRIYGVLNERKEIKPETILFCILIK